MVIAPRIEHGSRALFKCKDGFQLVGPTNVTECYYGNWTGEPPACQESESLRLSSAKLRIPILLSSSSPSQFTVRFRVTSHTGK